ncbi:unnamed protein product, partial [Urochloa humidicola]
FRCRFPLRLLLAPALPARSPFLEDGGAGGSGVGRRGGGGQAPGRWICDERAPAVAEAAAAWGVSVQERWSGTVVTRARQESQVVPGAEAEHPAAISVGSRCRNLIQTW